MDYSKEHDKFFLQGAAQALHDENAHLRADRAARETQFEIERAAFTAKLAELSAAYKTANDRALQLEQELTTTAELEAALKAANDRTLQLEQELAILKELLALREQALFGRSTERRTLKNKAANSATKARKQSKQRKGHGPTPQPELPVVEVTHTLVGEKLTCDACGGQLKPVDTLAEATELIALEKRKLVLERHLRKVYACSCGECMKTAPGPSKLIAGGRYDLSLTVHVAYQKYFAHVPTERQAKMLSHDGLRITTATLCDQLDALATALAPTYDAIWKSLQSEPVLRADETPWAVLSNGFNPNEKYYAWVVVGTQYVAFRLLDTRSAQGAATVLGEFAGTLMVDGLTSYPAAAKAGPGESPRFKVANCHAHARRKFVEIEQHWPAESTYAVGMYRKLYDIERDARQPGANKTEWRATRSRAVLDELITWAKGQTLRPDVLPSSGLAKALAYLLNHEEGLRVYLDDPAVPIDNNESERAVRPTVLGRANYQGSRSRRGTEVHAILSTMVESAKRCEVPPEAYLQAAAENALRQAGAVLLPDEFKRQLEAVRAGPEPRV